ncbi:histone-like nucleoid-structuring protein, MvaT/MvaU family, partial [Halomonas sp. THAF12]|uniref:histone-like nucleoid-structuring protein, MvaT/MvaU family n=1 Tax=Halomonas sp. B23F22_10 TaxID=3459515 RepID=UPI00373F5B67
MQEFDKTASDVIEVLTPGKDNASRQQANSGRRKRKLKIYKNPETGEVIETRGGNQKTLKAWKDKHGAETVETCLVRTED